MQTDAPLWILAFQGCHVRVLTAGANRTGSAHHAASEARLPGGHTVFWCGSEMESDNLTACKRMRNTCIEGEKVDLFRLQNKVT